MMVTGGLGFIGSAFLRLAARDASTVNVDAFTYAADPRRLEGLDVRTERLDVADAGLRSVVDSHRPRVIVHFAAESHVTRSESGPDVFFRTNVEGTRNVMDAALAIEPELVLHVSTDEVYGPCPAEPFAEDDKGPGEGRATSAYARSKALADDLAMSYRDRLPVIVARPTNCFGPWQHPEKAIARWTIRALRGQRLPVWGDGQQVRDWMFVEDACRGLNTLIEHGEPGLAYNLAPQGSERTNLEMAEAIAAAAGLDRDAVYLTAYDRPQHDRRYAVDAARVRALGWDPEVDIESRVGETVAWYRAHEDWWRALVGEAEGLYSDAEERAS